MESLGLNILEESEAGIEFQGKLEACYRANLWLRTAGRILCRLPAIKVGAREELFTKTVRFPWELWLNAQVPVRVEVHLKASRLTHSGLVQKAFQDALRQRFEKLGQKVSFLGEEPSAKERNEKTFLQGEALEACQRTRKSNHFPGSAGLRPAVCAGGTPALPERSPFSDRLFEQRILVRVENKNCVISLDTTGAHLHLRGYRIHHGGAPLRETLAAALILQSGWTPDVPFLDGMCGAGTAVIEAALIAANMAPGRHRRFLFEKWPSFQEKTWAYLLKKADAGIKDLKPGSLIGVDIDPKAVAIAQENARRAGVASWVMWHEMPFESVNPLKWSLNPGVVFLNPPYGIRLEADHTLYKRLLLHLGHRFQGWKAIVLAPRRELLMSGAVRPRKIRHLRHGGLPIVAGYYDL